ncbi:F-box protein At3g07870-like [Papaver somniferum]|uniref:F-box protein At3g07870-like n=1 Tax=Papaver somniferum TaxID=3469 RepID=UPI000E6FA434|nr:F-box protein At3g07870-like [Papaver somniferum]
MAILHFLEAIGLLANTNSMEKLPMEILENILDRLPIETALQAKRVCKTWRILLRCKTDKDYIYTNTLLGSCNGLVCFSPFYGRNHFLICNPFTGEVVYVPKHNSMEQKLSCLSGFGYCHSTNEYKIVIMHNKFKVKVLVYTIGGGGWRSKGSMDPIFTLNYSGIYANGALHWQDRHDRIVAFDLENEKFHYIPLPLSKHDRYNRSLKLLGGNNLYMVLTNNDKPYCMDIWTCKRKSTNASANGCDMKQNYNDTNSWDWIKEFSIEWKEMGWDDMI